ncbi:hypothetical protein BKA69DRAFT_1122527 [Paraphysoderma sedebokerense]|nr:hypothetical protein BKA69DRAFT_1122527 [Paraphysoderma sedebokerense]
MQSAPTPPPHSSHSHSVPYLLRKFPRIKEVLIAKRNPFAILSDSNIVSASTNAAANEQETVIESVCQHTPDLQTCIPHHKYHQIIEFLQHYSLENSHAIRHQLMEQSKRVISSRYGAALRQPQNNLFGFEKTIQKWASRGNASIVDQVESREGREREVILSVNESGHPEGARSHQAGSSELRTGDKIAGSSDNEEKVDSSSTESSGKTKIPMPEELQHVFEVLNLVIILRLACPHPYLLCSGPC